MKPILLATAFACPLIPGILLGVNTANWTAQTEAQFAEGQLSSVVVGSPGELKLSRSTRAILADTPMLNIVYAIRPTADGTIYLANGPRGSVVEHKAGKTRELFKADDSSLITALALDAQGRLLAGISGAKGRLVRIDPATGSSEDLYLSSDTCFIWAICPLPDGAILLGTGPTGALVEIQPDGKPRTLYQIREANILCILPGDKDELFIGTDPEGLVIRVNRKTGASFILYDAEESEIVALARDSAGRLFAAASSAAEPGAAEESGPSKTAGRTEPETEVPLHREPVTPPEPPVLPNPAPGEPSPMPKVAEPAKRLAIGDLDEEQPPLAPPTTAKHATSKPSHGGTGAPSMPPVPPPSEGGASAVYQIDPAGFVREVFRKPVTIHSMLYADGRLLIGTGPEGLLYQVNPESDETLVIARAESHDISALATAPNGNILLGLSNPGGLSEMDGGFAAKGTFVSQVLDAEQVSRFGKLQLLGTLAPKTAVTVATRSGNVRNVDVGGWSNWSDELPAAEFIQIPSPPARFFQYRLTLTTTDPHTTPTIDSVKVNYLTPNMPPRIASLNVQADTVEPDANGNTASPAVYHITWEATDPNKDHLVYSLYYRFGYRGEWVPLKDKLQETSFVWNTRQLADGRYQVKLVASDAPSNPPDTAMTALRISDPITIDNTPPTIGDVKTEVKDGQLTVSLRAVDRISTIAGVDFSLDASDDWQAASSSDMLFDSPDETVRFTVPKLSPGQHQLTIRARDSRGNMTIETLIVSGEQQQTRK